MHSQINFGYPWYLSWGHLLLAVPSALAAWRLRNRWVRAVCLVVVFWALSAWAVLQVGLGVQRRATLPTANFLASGAGRVLDLGAGTGRSAMMVLEARPQATLVALDEFGPSFEMHFGKSAEHLLLENLKAAGVASRVTVEKADMRKIPISDASFDAIVSAYAIDHLGRRGAEETLREAYRVLKPGGEFLFIVTNADFWLRYMAGPLLVHNRMRGMEDWRPILTGPGFQVAEQGNSPGTLFVLLRKPAMAP